VAGVVGEGQEINYIWRGKNFGLFAEHEDVSNKQIKYNLGNESA
jgi:hypothetical protein